MAMRAAIELEDGMIVNLGVGMPTLVSSFIMPQQDIIFHSENGVLGFGPIVEDKSKADAYLINATVQPVSAQPGMCFMSHDESFALIRGRFIDVTILGALQVAANGDLANYHLPGKAAGSLGGGQDLAFCSQKVIAMMKHVTKDGQPKILKKLTLPLTAPGAVDLIVTDIAVLEVTGRGLVLAEHAPGWTVQEIQKLTEARLTVSPELKEITLG
ncbi:MAG: hypothetical protein GEU28_05610 [Dehalococcoidia bacterium]|nr:hypothetical protein [Dehalococcoidia bacterium]